MGSKGAPKRIERAIATLSSDTYAVIGRDQLIAAGVTPREIQRSLDSGRLRREYRGVYATTPTPLCAKGRWLAAVRACGPNAVLSHRSAAALWEIRPHRSQQSEVTVAGRGGRKPRRAVTLYRPTRLSTAEVTTHERIPVTTPARTLIDLAGVLPRRPLERAVDEAYRRRLLDEHALRRALERNGGRRGTDALAALLRTHAAGSTLTRNDLEELLLKLCDDNGIPRPIANAEVGPYSPDFLWPEQRLIVETDGRASHGTRAAFEHDRARDAQLTASGYRVVRFTYRQVLNEPDGVARLIARLLPPPAHRSPA